MSHLSQLNFRMRKTRKLLNSREIWERVVTLAVLSNPYHIDIQLRVLLLIKLRMYESLLVWADAMSQQVYETPMLHYRMHQLCALIRKYPFPVSMVQINRTENARRKFLEAEERCRLVNRRMRYKRITGLDRYSGILEHAKRYVAYTLGGVSSSDEDSSLELRPPIAKIYSQCDITGGAAIDVHGNATNLARKIMAKCWTVTPGALPYALGAVWSNFHMTELLLRGPTAELRGEDLPEGPVCLDKALFEEVLRDKTRLVTYNKISFVPKTAVTDRTIAVEPFLNSFLQRGVDQYMRQRLLRVGIDLSDQGKNQKMAFLGSRDPEEEDPYVTIDLSSASDTLATEVVADLLPPEWFDFLDSLRCKSYKMNGYLGTYHKFTSMGNGFCFPLETLIFASLCHSAYRESNLHPDFRVYGDDIIVRRSVAHRVLELLGHYGFIPNPRKTFIEGPFRESCGQDWHGGVNVRPIYLNKPLDSFERLFGFHNQTLRRESYVRDYFEQIREFLWNCAAAFGMNFVTDFDPNPRPDTSAGEDWDPISKEWDGVTIDGAFWVPRDVYMASGFTRYNYRTQSWSHPVIRTTPAIDEKYIALDEGGNHLIFLIGGLRGGSAEATFTLRYSARTKVTDRKSVV